MGKLLLFVVIAVAVYLLLRSARSSEDKATASRGQRRVAESMVACAYCGLHVPKGESIDAGGQTYCCTEHRRLDAGDSGS